MCGQRRPSTHRSTVCSGVLGVDVDERDLAALAGEVLHDGAADAVGSARDEHGAVDERRVAGVFLDGQVVPFVLGMGSKP